MSAPSEIVGRALAVLARETATGGAGGAGATNSAPDGRVVLEDLRREAYDWIDRVLALIGGGGGNGAGLFPPAPVSLGAPIAEAAPATADVGRALAPAGVLRPGSVVTLPLRLANDDASEAPLTFLATDLLGASGHRIPAAAVSFSPGAATLRPNQQTTMQIQVAVPSGTPPGRYGGLVQLVGQPDARRMISIEVQ